MSEGIVSLSKFQAHRSTSVRAVVLAGGKGTRLAPYTSVLPKPLMPIGDRAILELLIGQLRDCGINKVTLCVGYLSHLIEAVLGNRAEDSVDISYVREQETLGTAAPLRLVDGLDSTFITMNGDVLTTLNYQDLVRLHHRDGNVLTIATHTRPIQIDYGVLTLGTNGSRNRVKAYLEKPKMTSTVSMGIYVVEPRALSYIPEEGYFDFPNLVHALLDAGERVGAYPFEGMWFDIGRQDDYERAVSAWAEQTGDADAAQLATGAV